MNTCSRSVDDDNQATGDLITKMTVALWWLYIPFAIITIHHYHHSLSNRKLPGLGISGKIQLFCTLYLRFLEKQFLISCFLRVYAISKIFRKQIFARGGGGCKRKILWCLLMYLLAGDLGWPSCLVILVFGKMSVCCCCRIILLIARRGVGYQHIHGEMRPCNDR